MAIGIILAGGKGTRLKSSTANKVILPFLNKPMILYGVELLEPIVSKLIVVVGAFSESVKNVLHNHNITYANQEEQLGTAHAVKIALNVIQSSDEPIDHVIVGYGDHMMFYSIKTANDLIQYHKDQKAVITLVTAILPDPHKYGRIIRNSFNDVVAIVEEKDANNDELVIKEINAGLYCFDYQFLKENINKIEKSSITNEYYLTDLIKIAVTQHKKVAGLVVLFEKIGIGINTTEELQDSQKIYALSKSSP
ncbi:MAG: sugar phosphate nucleotidyltransferase [bacterium]|nr:sugar phosphate nucleotidyltransferase [bacterium]